MRVHVDNLMNYVGKEVILCGWLSNRRDHGKLVFLDLEDVTGVIQVVGGESDGRIPIGSVIEVKGVVGMRPPKMVNHSVSFGDIEVGEAVVRVLNESETHPFPTDNDGYDVDEEIRLRYRYLDLQRRRLKKNLFVRHRVMQFIREWLSREKFIEVETPILTKSTPEGARDYVVPSRMYPGHFYALPQSPQQYKQLLMVSGIERYFQIARCFRDEDTRGDRQPEFSQLDIEMSFIEREDVMSLTENLLIALVEKLFPEMHIHGKPFPRMSYSKAMEEHGTDRPDLRLNKNDKNELAFVWIIDFPFFERDEKKDGWTFTHNPFSKPLPEHVQYLLEKKDVGNIRASQYDIVLNGFEIGGGSIRSERKDLLKAVFEIIGYKKEEIEKSFGHMLTALSYGAPPHGGIAWGLDRLLAILCGEPNIREVIAFPKTGEGRDPMMGAPAPITEEQLNELNLRIVKKTK